MQLCRPKRRCTLARLGAIDLRAQTQIPRVLRSDTPEQLGAERPTCPWLAARAPPDWALAARAAETGAALRQSLAGGFPRERGRLARSAQVGAVANPAQPLPTPAGPTLGLGTCDRNVIEVELNGEKVTRMDLGQWARPNLRPDGSRHK